MGIVTLPYHAEEHRAVSFDVIAVDADRIFLVDLSAEWNRYASVKGAAGEVVRHCNDVYGNRRIIVHDAKKGWQEITATDGAADVKPYVDKVPIRVELEMLGRSSGGA